MAEENDLVTLTADVVAAFFANSSVRLSAEDIPAIIANTHAALAGLENKSAEQASASERRKPAVSPRSSVKPDFITSLLDGKQYKTLKRHLKNNGFTPQSYREEFGLKADYPMVAPAYSEHRRQVAKALGLGRKPGAKAPARKAGGKRGAAAPNS